VHHIFRPAADALFLQTDRQWQDAMLFTLLTYFLVMVLSLQGKTLQLVTARVKLCTLRQYFDT
jgi:hypothetical protein